MSVEIQLPFQLGPNGIIATVTEASVIADQHVQALISTVQGERVMVPTYGLNLAGLIFGNNDPILVNVIQNDVINAFQLWEPSIQLTNVNPAQSTDAQQGIAAVDVEYIVTNTNAVGTATTPIYQQATLSTGGTIVNV
jgi:uncharacterized protein